MEQGELEEESKISDLSSVGCNRLKDAAKAISKSGRSIYTLAVVSGKQEAVDFVDDFVRKHFDKREVGNTA